MDTMAQYNTAKLGAYTQINVETSSQGKLVVMLFNAAIRRAEEAKRQMESGRRDEVHNHLMRAQDIITELRGALNMSVRPISQDLDRIYEYLQHLLISANLRKDSAPIDECVRFMKEIRDMWEEAFAAAARENKALGAMSAINTLGHSSMNLST